MAVPDRTQDAERNRLMEALLKHMIDITGQRDHTLLDSSVVSALQSLSGAAQVRVHELISQQNEPYYLRPKAWTENGKVVLIEECLDAGAHAGAPLSRFPALISAIRERKSCVEEMTDCGRVLWMPMWMHDKVHLCLEVIRPVAHSDQTLGMLEGILSVYRNYQSILDYSERDSLTGLLNRKTFDERFSRLLNAATPERTSSNDNNDERRHHVKPSASQWLAVADIDHFKRVNDQYGHLYGDEVLILIANLLRHSFREQDRIFRFGGEEFVILLRSTTLEEAHQIFERFRANVERHDFPQVGKVTVSIGFARITQESPVVTLGHADQALYYAKENGRNRVCHYDALIENGLLHSELASASNVEFF
jgi:diguanylate cyclase (GGDEF)-like protein